MSSQRKEVSALPGKSRGEDSKVAEAPRKKGSPNWALETKFLSGRPSPSQVAARGKAVGRNAAGWFGGRKKR